MELVLFNYFNLETKIFTNNAGVKTTQFGSLSKTICLSF
jgi:hypothetical protein